MAVVGVGSALMANRTARKGIQAQKDAAAAAASAFRGIKIPTIEEQSIILQNPDLVGQYTPEQVQAMEMNMSAMEQVKADPELVAKQNEALEGISEVAEGGYSESDKATAREVQRTVSQDAQARQKAILNNMSSRGVLGSGMELAAQLQSGQQAAEQMSRGGEGLTQQAQSRALAALGQQGQMASTMRQQDVGEQTDIARARDSINQFNVQNRQNISNQNVGLRNQAQLMNLQQRQAMEDQRAANANQQQIHNKSLLQTQYANRMGKEGQVQGANQAVAAAAAAKANATAGMIQGIGSAVAGGIGSYASMQNANDQAKLNRDNALEVAKYGKGQ
jgi:hypothetical protein